MRGMVWLARKIIRLLQYRLPTIKRFTESIEVLVSQNKIKDYPYTITEAGEIRRASTKHGVGTGDLIKPQLWRGKYRIRLRDEVGKQKAFWVYELVWNAFAGRVMEPDEELCFIDGDTSNHHFDNLAVRYKDDTRAIVKPQNGLMLPDIVRGIAIHGGGKKTRLFGEANPASILTTEIVIAIRYANGRYSYQQMIDKLGGIISKSAISKIIRGETWKHLDNPLFLTD